MYVVYTVFYHYFFRCPSYAQIPTSCHMEADPNDPCCRKPVCHYDPITGHTYIPIPAFAPAVTGKGVVEPPTSSDLLNNTQYTATVALFQTGFTPVPPTVQSNITGGIGRSRWRIVGKIAIFFFSWHETRSLTFVYLYPQVTVCTRENNTHSRRGGMMGVHSLVCARIPGLENTDVLKSEPVHL